MSPIPSAPSFSEPYGSRGASTPRCLATIRTSRRQAPRRTAYPGRRTWRSFARCVCPPSPSFAIYRPRLGNEAALPATIHSRSGRSPTSSRATWRITSRFSANDTGSSLDGDDRNLLQRSPTALGIRLALPRRDLLHGSPGGRRALEVLGVDAVHLRELVEVVQINVAGGHVGEGHAGLLQPVEQVAHGLAQLRLDSAGIDASI